VRFRDFLRVAVLLFGGAATTLAVVSVLGASREDSNTLVYVADGGHRENLGLVELLRERPDVVVPAYGDTPDMAYATPADG